jgi:hypothetical protein
VCGGVFGGYDDGLAVAGEDCRAEVGKGVDVGGAEGTPMAAVV